MRHFQRNYIFLLNFFFVVLMPTEIEARLDQDPSKEKKIKLKPVDASPPQSRCVVDEYKYAVIGGKKVEEISSFCREMYPTDTNGSGRVGWNWDKNNMDGLVYVPATFEPMGNCRVEEGKEHCPTDEDYIECHDYTNDGFYIINYIYKKKYEGHEDLLDELIENICPSDGILH
jgi:hypothetical protein